jgi:hypothetical protein
MMVRSEREGRSAERGISSVAPVPSRPNGASPKPLLRAGSTVVFQVDPEHVSWLARLPGNGHRWLPDQRGHRPPLRPIVEQRGLAERLRGGSELLVAIENGRLLGSCWIGREDAGPWRNLPAHAGYVTELVVAQGQVVTTVADVLLRAVRQRVFDGGRQVVRLTCGSGNRQLCAYLSRVSYRQVGVYEPTDGNSMALFEQRQPERQPDSSTAPAES